MIVDCPHCDFRLFLYQTDACFGELWCPRCLHNFSWGRDGKLEGGEGRGRLVRDLDDSASVLVAISKLRVTCLEVQGEFVEMAWERDQDLDYDREFFGIDRFDGTPGLYVWEGVVRPVDTEQNPPADRSWNYVDELLSDGGWILRPKGEGVLRELGRGDKWECLKVIQEDDQ